MTLTPFLAMAGLTLAMAAAAAHADPLGDLTWDKRVLVVLTAGTGEALDQQAALFKDAENGFFERDMVVFAVVGASRIRPLFGPAPKVDPAAVRARLGVPPDAPFAAVLIGKDGGVKWRAEAPVAPAAVFGVIDAMPMRQNEMRRDESRRGQGSAGGTGTP